MPTFQYQSLAAGGPANGPAVIDAPDRATAVRLLRQRGITPTKVDEVAGSRRTEQPLDDTGAGVAPARKLQLPGTAAMSRSEMASFIRELATAVEAGLPLIQALKTIQRQGRSPK